jgi:hypothetical protein
MSDRERINGPSEFTGRFVQRDSLLDEAVGRLDDIARALSAIDHKLDVLLARTATDASAVAVLAASLDRKPK